MSVPSEQPEARPASKGGQGWAQMPGGDSSQLDFDIEFFDRVLLRNPNYVEVLRCQGQLLTRKGMHDRALELDRRLVGLVPSDSVAHYNLACSLALLERKQEAIGELRAAFEYGYDDFAYLETDRDLDNLRAIPEFQALLKRYVGA